MEHSIDSRTTQLSAKEQRSLYDRQASLLFCVIYLVCLTLAAVALVVVAQIRTVNAYLWSFGVVFGPAIPAVAAAAAHYAYTTWHLVVEERSSLN